MLYLWVPLLIGYLEKVDVIPQSLGLEMQGEDQRELLRQSMWKDLTAERFDEVGLHTHSYRIASARRFQCLAARTRVTSDPRFHKKHGSYFWMQLCRSRIAKE